MGFALNWPYPAGCSLDMGSGVYRHRQPSFAAGHADMGLGNHTWRGFRLPTSITAEITYRRSVASDQHFHGLVSSRALSPNGVRLRLRHHPASESEVLGSFRAHGAVPLHEGARLENTCRNPLLSFYVYVPIYIYICTYVLCT